MKRAWQIPLNTKTSEAPCKRSGRNLFLCTETLGKICFAASFTNLSIHIILRIYDGGEKMAVITKDMSIMEVVSKWSETADVL